MSSEEDGYIDECIATKASTGKDPFDEVTLEKLKAWVERNKVDLIYIKECSMLLHGDYTWPLSKSFKDLKVELIYEPSDFLTMLESKYSE